VLDGGSSVASRGPEARPRRSEDRARARRGALAWLGAAFELVPDGLPDPLGHPAGAERDELGATPEIAGLAEESTGPRHGPKWTHLLCPAGHKARVYSRERRSSRPRRGVQGHSGLFHHGQPAWRRFKTRSVQGKRLCVNAVARRPRFGSTRQPAQRLPTGATWRKSLKTGGL